MTSIVKEWAAGNVRSTGGRLFRYGDVNELLVAPRIAGLRHADGKLNPVGAMPAIPMMGAVVGSNAWLRSSRTMSQAVAAEAA